MNKWFYFEELEHEGLGFLGKEGRGQELEQLFFQNYKRKRSGVVITINAAVLEAISYVVRTP